MNTLQMDVSGLNRRVEQMLARTAEASRAALAAYGEALVDNIDRIAPRDSNRYVAGWVGAGNAAGLTTRVVPRIQKSSRYDKFLDELRQQVERLEKRIRRWQIGMENWYHNRPERPRKGWYRKAEREVRKLYKRYVRAIQELGKAEASETFLFFDAGAFVERKNKRALSTVRTKVYGGTGKIVTDGWSAKLELHNLEPHATIVEARFGVVAIASRGVKALGYRKASKEFIARIQGLAGAVEVINKSVSTSTARNAA